MEKVNDFVMRETGPDSVASRLLDHESLSIPAAGRPLLSHDDKKFASRWASHRSDTRLHARCE